MRRHVTDQLLTSDVQQRQRIAEWSNGALAVYNAFEPIPRAITCLFIFSSLARGRIRDVRGVLSQALPQAFYSIVQSNYRTESIPFLTWDPWLRYDPRSSIALAHRVLSQVPRHKTLHNDSDGTGVSSRNQYESTPGIVRPCISKKVNIQRLVCTFLRS